MNIRGESRAKRRAVSGVLAALLLFSMIFSVGSGYYLFVSSAQSQYSQALANKGTSLQSKSVESLKINPTSSGASNHLVFTATNIGGTAANITDVFVLDPGGVTHTYGLGFGPNTTPALPGGVTPQKTSTSYDTGITIVPGTYTIKVITHRGNAYTATYPVVPTSFTSSTGSLAVDLSSFKWVQLTGTSSITQENYVANCNAALCGAGFSSNVASGDIIVYAVGWPNHAAPATPTDTRGNTFTLGASNSVSASSGNPPTLVQSRYTSNCASSLCGLAYSSNVATGNTLAFALGWLNQSPPSTPTDTLGDTYTLGVSNSLTGPTPTLVQNNYQSNCGSSSCGLGYSTPVTAGDTLAFALGWYDRSPPSTPTDTRGDTFSLGASNSVSGTGLNPPTLVQSRYTSNCNSASCGLAFTSNVATGNTLVFGLGWSVAAPYYVPITLTNSQGTATPATFQQLITWNPSTYSAYESSSLGNIRFCADSACATTLNAWVESCAPSCTTSATSASAWVKLTSAIAASGGTKTIYMVFQATTVGFDGNYWGEAPTIPGTYGQNDNGANVFTFYDNFAGTSLSVKWTVVKSSLATVTVSNGATFYTPASTDYAFVNSATQTYPQVAESYMVSRGPATGPTLGITTSNSVNTGVYPYNGYALELFRFSGVDYLILNSETSSASTNLAFQAKGFNAGIWQIIWPSLSVQSATDGAFSLSATSSSPSPIANYGIYVGQSNDSPGSDVVQWGRMRAYPPSNVMPSTSLGSVAGGSNAPSSVSDTLGDAFTLGVSNSVAGPAPTLVQNRYTSNCNSASCGLAFTSNVVSGNTLVFGLGWSSVPQSYAPVTLTNNQACALALDGSASGSGAQSATATLTTTCFPDVIYVSLAVDAGSIITPTAAGLTFTLRGTQTSANNVGKVNTYYAIASSALSAKVISATSSGSSALTIIAWGISGANTASPFDPHTGFPGSASGTGTVSSVTVSTTNANDFILGANVDDSPGQASTAPSPFTLIATLGSASFFMEGSADYETVGSAQANLLVKINGGASVGNWGIIADAIQGSGISVDNKATSTATSDGSGHITISFTVGTGTNRLLIVGGTADNRAITGVTYAGTPLTQAVADTQLPMASIWYLVNPPSGTASVVVTTTASKAADIGVISFTGVDQTTPIPTTATNDNANGRTSPATVSITNANANAWVIDVVGAGNSAGFTNGASTTTQWNISESFDSGASSTSGPLSANTVTNFSWTLGTADDWIDLAVEIEPSAGTSTPFPQKIVFNPSTYSTYEASNLGNIRFCSDAACANPLFYAWLESCTPSCTPTATSATVWVKLNTAISGGGGTLTIYMEFYPLSTNFDGVYWGEAPGLSGTYGQYDNGAQIFGSYWNFSGTSLPSGWSSSTTASVNNQLSISAGSVYTNSAVFSSLNHVVEMYAEYTSLNSGGYSGLTQSNSQAPQSSNTGSNAEILWMTNSGSNVVYAFAGDGSTASYNLQAGVSSGFTPTLNTFYVLGSLVTSSQVVETQNYATLLSASGTYNRNQYIILGYFSGSSAGTTSINPITIQWTRTRALPPNNVMPSTSFGSLTVATTPLPLIADTLGDSFTLGVSNSVASGSYVYYSYIWYAAAGSSAADTITATFPSAVTGSVSIYELRGAITSGLATSTGSSPGSTSITVTSFTPGANSFVIGNAETSSSSSTFTAGSGYTSVLTGAGGCDPTHAAQGCSEYQTGVGTATTVPFTLGASVPWVETAIAFAPYTYYSYIWYANAGTSGADTITASFTATVTGSVSIYEINGASITSPPSSTGGNSGGSTTPSVTSFIPGVKSFVIGNVETSSSTSSFTAGSGYTSVLTGAGGCDPTHAAQGCSEYQTPVSSATTVPFALGVSASWVESAISFAPPPSVYYSYIWYATAGTSGADTISASFSSSVTGSVSIYEITGNSPSIFSSTGSSSLGSTTPSVTSFTPVPNSIVIGNAETGSASSSFTVGSGFTLPASCSSVFGCSEYKTGVNSATTAPFTLGSSAPWVESAIAFGPYSYYSYIWYATAGGSGADTITASFASTVTGSVSMYEVSGATTTGALTSTGSSSAGSTTLSVTLFTPSTGSFVIGNAETGAPSSTFTAGGGYTLSAACSSVYGCAEYQTGVGSLTTVQFTLGASIQWVESAISFPPSPYTYYSYIWYATAGSSGADTITASFSSTVAGSVSIYDFAGYTTTGFVASTGSSVAGSTTASVAPLLPGANSIVIANVETPSASTSYAAGVGYNLVNQFNCTPSYGCGEYHVGLGTTTTAPFTLSSSTPWVESAISFASGATYQNGLSVGGYPALGVPNEVSIIFAITLTNQDPQGRSVTLWPQSALAASVVKCSGGEDGSCGEEEGGSTITPYFIIDGVNGPVNGIVKYNSTQNLITLAPGVKTTLFFGARTPLGSSTNTIEEEVQSLFTAFFALTGQFSDGTLYGQTIPYTVGIVTGAAASTSANSGGTGASITVTGSGFNPSARAFIGWIDSTGKITSLTKFTTDGSGNIPAGTTFLVPSGSTRDYTIIVSDYVNTIFRTFQHT